MYIVKNALGVGVPASEAGLSGNQPPTLVKNKPHTLGKSATDFREIRHRFWGNPSPILGKSAADFGEIRHRLWEICHRLWGKQPPTLRSSVFWEQIPFLP